MNGYRGSVAKLLISFLEFRISNSKIFKRKANCMLPRLYLRVSELECFDDFTLEMQFELSEKTKFHFIIICKLVDER